ncbi:MAG: DNA adenine methylase [Polyangiaceae bacterium]|nr:DNA adenine methylase [Polyangiaceae bacterium]
MPKVVHRANLPLIVELPTPRPFLKWVGGKTQLLDQLCPLLPEMFGRYFEPFVGGAALFFALRPPRASLRDVNEELIDCYRAIRDEVDSVIEALGEHRYERKYYYIVRELDPRSLPRARRAARTIFLNKTGFNGLYRVNSAGRFNVPFGRHTNPAICDEDNLRSCSLALQGVELEVRDFRQIVKDTAPGDFVYFDPPYAPISDTADFISYAVGGFGWADQENLAEAFSDLTKKGVYAMLSNSNAPGIRDLYAGFTIEEVSAVRSVNSNISRRGKIAEIVVRNYERRLAQANGKSRRRVQRIAV